MENLWHVVLISFKPNTPEKIRWEIYNRYQTLGEDCGGKNAGILFWRVGLNLDLRKNVHLVEIAAFKNDDAFQAFRRHPRHQEITALLSNIADWHVGDIYHPFFSDS